MDFNEILSAAGVLGVSLALSWKLLGIVETLIRSRIGGDGKKEASPVTVAREHVLWPYLERFSADLREMTDVMHKMQDGLYGQSGKDGVLTRLALNEQATINNARRLDLLEQIVKHKDK